MAAELVGGAFLSASLQVLFDRLASRQVLNLIQAKKLKEKSLDRLKTILYAASAVLNDAEYKQISDPAVKNWLDDLRDAVYQADDLLDEISTEVALQQQEVPNFFTRSFNNYLHYREMGNKIDDIIQRLELVVKHRDILGLREGERGNLWKPDQSTSLVEPSDVYGRENEKEVVINFLLDDTRDSNLSVIPIVGMGGIGKTTLAQLVYNDDRVKQQFHPKAWVCVFEVDVSKITKSIIEAVTSRLCVVKDLNLLQLDLKENLSGNKFLIVLDDVWNEDYAKWILLQKPFQYGAKGSKIILTTRSEKAASIVQTIRHCHLHLNDLSEEDSWSLFKKHAFASMDLGVKSSLEQIGRDIVRKCQGLPLAIQAIGGLLRSKPNTKDWNNILKNAMLNLQGSNIFHALSYHYLPPQLKQCFAYCSLFPKNHQFDKEELILMWMAEGLLESSETKMTLEEVGSMYFDTLTSRSFFQCLNNRWGGSYFLMHDLIHDLSMLVAGEFYQRLEVGEDVNKINKKTRHLSWDASQATALCRVELESVRTLICWNPLFYHNTSADAILLHDLLRSFLSKLKCLRVLSFCHFKNLDMLPDWIDQLIHLRYLDMSFTDITSLPESLCKLYNLQTLKLVDCRLVRLPKDMQDLVNLRYLDISDCPLTGMPKGMSKLNNLQFLSDFVVEKDGAMMEELGSLPNLSKRLVIRNLEYVSSGEEASKAKLMDKKQIEKLHLRWYWSSNNDCTLQGSETERDILGKLQPHPNLKSLTIEGYRGTRFPNWLGDPLYNNIVDLQLSHCRNCFMLPPLGQLPSLKSLWIQQFEKMVRIGEEFYKSDESSSSSLVTPTPFASLEFLQFWGMSAWEEWYFIEAAFPKLRHLTIGYCPKLRGELPIHQLLSLETLDTRGCFLLQGNQ